MCGLVRRRGLEPLCLAALAPQASASANFATSALNWQTETRSGEQSEGKYNISSGFLGCGEERSLSFDIYGTRLLRFFVYPLRMVPRLEGQCKIQTVADFLF
jgi:hypothetical protein